MSPARNKAAQPRVDRNQIARAIFKIAESMGISDRGRVEQLTSKVIERLEQTPSLVAKEIVAQPLPGMEELVLKPRHTTRLLSDAEIQALVKEILEADERRSSLRWKQPLSFNPVSRPHRASISAKTLFASWRNAISRRINRARSLKRRRICCTAWLRR
jgi:hypothetical protein